MGSMFWAISMVIFSVLEIVIPGLITIWLALSSLILTILTLFFTNITMEFLLFSIFSLVFVLFTRPFVQKYFQGNKRGFNSKFIGQNVNIERIISSEKKEKIYDVKFKGSLWTGISEDNFTVGDSALIKDFQGNKIVLEKIKLDIERRD